MTEKRNDTNFLRVLAILLIVNSHMRGYYPNQFSFLATGGMIGNALFFVLSSWGLFLSMQKKPRAFGDWYARRITRIYPSVWMVVILLTFPLGIYYGSIGLGNLLDEMGKFFYPPFWFLQALLLYYCVIYVIMRKFSYRRLVLVSIPILALYVLYYVFFLDHQIWSIETPPFRLIFYLLVVLWGLYIGAVNDKIRFRGLRDVCILLLCITCIYFHKYLMQQGLFLWLQFIQHAVAFPMLYYFAKVAKSRFIRDRIMNSAYLGRMLTLLSAMTLEIFMVNNSIDALCSKVSTFPLNVLTVLGLNMGFGIIIFNCGKYIRRIIAEDKYGTEKV
jgi:peptidoglycan/LPS O-acetylase OafA/YrhL